MELLLERSYTACEIDFEGGFWMKDEYAWASRFGELAAEQDIALSVHAPIAAILGHLPSDEQKRKRAFGMLDHTAGVAVACGAELENRVRCLQHACKGGLLHEAAVGDRV